MRWLAIDRSMLVTLAGIMSVLLVTPVAAEPVSKLRELSLRVGGVTKVSELECTFEVEESSAGLRSELTIPLRKVVWSTQREPDGRAFAKATCRDPKDECMKGRMEGRTLDVPHQFFWEKAARTTYLLPLGSLPVRELGRVVDALRDAPQLCKKPVR